MPSVNSNPFESALAQWLSVLGESRIASTAQAGFGPCTSGANRNVPVVLQPGSREEVAEIMKIASRWRIKVYPVSTGNNWGYGAANPANEDCVIIDLRSLNRIRDFDPELGVVTVEPGVTQAQLGAFLDSHGANYLVPVTGAGPNCSLLGNALERGYGITPTTDHFAAVTTLEAILPDGRFYRTPLTELGGGEVDRLFKWGLGPYLDGLFSQGNFGIVTSATIALAPAPETITAFFFSTKDDRKLEALVPTVRDVLRSLGGTVVAVNLLNRQRMLSMMTPFPVEKAEDGVLPADEVAKMAQQHGIAAWNGVGAIYANKDMVKAARRSLRRLLGPVTDRLVFVNARRVNLARRLARLMPKPFSTRIGSLADTLGGALEIMHGRPNDVALALAYWRSGQQPQPGVAKNPARDGCGLLWFAPLVPMRGKDARRFVDMVERICPAYGINPLVTLTTINDRCFDSTVPLLFDRNDPAATERAAACYQALLNAGQQEGFLPYRLNIDAMGLMENNSVFSTLSSQLKSALDPHHLLSPGRYVPLREQEPS